MPALVDPAQRQPAKGRALLRSRRSPTPPSRRRRRAAQGVAPSSRPAVSSTTSLRTEACEPVSPSSRNTSGIATSDMSDSMSAQPSSASAASSSAPEVDSMVLRSVRLRAARSRFGDPSSLLPEVQQAAGDDVALHFGGAAVDGGRARVQELGAPGGVVELDALPAAGRVRCRRAAVRRWPATPCRSRCPGPASGRRPAGAGWRGSGSAACAAPDTPRPSPSPSAWPTSLTSSISASSREYR